MESLKGGGFEMPAGNLWAFLIRYVCPIAVAFVLAFIIITQQYF
jgi:hypothetical protein